LKAICCVDAVAKTRISPGGEYNPKTLTLRIAKQEPIRWPHKQPLLIDGLDLQTNHLVLLTSDGKRIQSFRFKFSEDDDARLCIYFDGFYEKVIKVKADVAASLIICVPMLA
jgi:hypothetical protein